ncbi:Leucine-rich repeat-containing protein 71 [Borealophlyctis nickersoniae]|nr:Leucine-rich repeat-containing protein 71 [Borealophlyctis nickersoniae]
MAADTEEPPEAHEYTGNFETDYLDACRRANTKPLTILKIGHPLPPIPIAIASPPASVADAKEGDTAGGNAEATPAASADAPKPGDGDGVATTDVARRQPRLMNYQSRYRYTPTLVVETTDTEEEEEVYKVEMRGWKIRPGLMEVLSQVVPACSTITHLTLWNCGLTEPHFHLLLTTVLTASIRVLTLDQNPSIPDTLFAYLITEESSLKSLSLRANNITDAGAKALAAALKTNRVLTSLSLWDNRVGKEGAEAVAEALRVNATLGCLSLGRNSVGDEGAVAFAKVLSNYALLHDELMSRKKMMADLDKQRREQEEDPIVKKAKGRLPTSHGRNSSAKLPVPRTTSVENITKPPLLDPKSKLKQKGGKKGDPSPSGASAPAPATTAAAAPAPTAAAGNKKTPDAGAATAAAGKGKAAGGGGYGGG